jgi:single-stranded-DNA-specific exonuclease
MTSGPRIRRREPVAADLGVLHPVVARVLAGRGIHSADELDPSLARLHPPSMAGLEQALARLEGAHVRGERVLVVGDFDADGATSAALAVRALRAFGFAWIDYLVPTRFESGYGLTPALVDVAAGFEPDLLVTVDNGIGAFEGVAAAQARGIDTIVTDHHLPGEALPEAPAVVNPNRGDCDFPSKNLAGVGVTFYLLSALRTRLDRTGRLPADAAAPPRMAAFLDLVALGTVADVVALDRNNRILVEQGLRRIRAGRASAGVEALLAVGGCRAAEATATDLAYSAGPRLNAAGRLGDIGVAIDALLSDDAEHARTAAAELDRINSRRREIETRMRAQAEAAIERLRASLAADAALPAAVTLFDARWHEGVVGILAGRVREAVHRPTAVFADAGDGALKGSVRSIEGLHVRDVLARIATARPQVIQGFGGHAMAAGVTIAAERLDDFRAAFASAVAAALGTHEPVREIVTDGPLGADELILETAEALRAAGPWGAGFPVPLFDGVFDVRGSRRVGGDHLKLRVAPAEGGGALEAMVFRATAAQQVGAGERVRLVYRFEVNAFNGRRRPQLVVDHLLPAT